MSHAFGIATRIKVKKSTPPELIDFLDYLYGLGKFKNESVSMPAAAHQIVKSIVETLASVLTGSSGYMRTWRWRVKEDHGDHWLYESRTASSSTGEPEFLLLMNGILEHLYITDGDIVYRSVYEESAIENILYFSEGCFAKRRGYEYASDNGYITDWEHPYREELTTVEEQQINSGEYDPTQRTEYGSHLLWTVGEIDADFAKKERRRLRIHKLNRGRGGYGFGDN